jgi:hypothetical protein
MARSPEYTLQPGQEGKDLAGVRSCGCITAAMVVKFPPGQEYANATVKEVREFYASMAESGREVRWMPTEEISAGLTMGCPHRDAA